MKIILTFLIFFSLSTKVSAELRTIHVPHEAEGLELTELPEEIERLLILESHLRLAIS